MSATNQTTRVYTEHSRVTYVYTRRAFWWEFIKAFLHPLDYSTIIRLNKNEGIEPCETCHRMSDRPVRLRGPWWCNFCGHRQPYRVSP